MGREEELLMGLRAAVSVFALSGMISFGVVAGTTPAAADCGATHAQAKDSKGSYQVLVTFAPETPPERISEISHKLGIAIEQRVFDRIVVGRAPAGQPLASVKAAAQGFPEILAVEPSSRVTPQ